MLVAAVAFTGCISAPVPDARPTLPDRWLQGGFDRPTAIGGLGTAHWWHALGDSQLDALIDQALAANLDVGQSAAKLRAARVLSRAAPLQFLPQLAFNTADPIDPDASASYLVAGFDSVWELGLFGRREAVRRLARGQLDAASADEQGARAAVAAEVAREWISLRAAQHRAASLEQLRQIRTQELRLYKVRERLRLGSGLQVDQAQRALLQVDGLLPEARQSAIASAQSLAVLVASAEPDVAWQQPGKMPTLKNFGSPSAPADLLRNRPDVARAQAELLQAAGELGIARADRFPDVSLGGSIVISTSEAQRRATDTGAIGSIGPMISIPLFDWGIRRAKALAKGELLDAAAMAYRKAVLTAVSEVETTLAAEAQLRLQEQTNAAALAGLDRIVRLTTRNEQLGLASGLDIAASKFDREQARMDLEAVQAARALNYVAWCKALGGGFSERSESPSTGTR